MIRQTIRELIGLRRGTTEWRAEYEAQIRALNELLDIRTESLIKALDQRDTLQQRFAGAMDSLGRYGRHLSWCAVARLNDMDVSCDCDLDMALRGEETNG